MFSGNTPPPGFYSILLLTVGSIIEKAQFKNLQGCPCTGQSQKWVSVPLA